MEVHLVHTRKTGDKSELLVLGVFFKAGKANALVQKVWDSAPKEAGPAKVTEPRITASDLLPRGKYQLYRYDGSLTTPPCTENVRWYVYSVPLEISVDQVKAFQSLFPMNARPVKPANDRVVEISGVLGS